MTVFELAMEWSEKNFESVNGKPWSADELSKTCLSLLKDFPGDSTKRWLFVYSPSSLEPLFEVSADFSRVVVATAKLATVANAGGMLLGADFSEGPGAPAFMPLAVCKPKGQCTEN
jgi:hypothetical protein